MAGGDEGGAECEESEFYDSHFEGCRCNYLKTLQEDCSCCAKRWWENPSKNLFGGRKLHLSAEHAE